LQGIGLESEYTDRAIISTYLSHTDRFRCIYSAQASAWKISGTRLSYRRLFLCD